MLAEIFWKGIPENCPKAVQLPRFLPEIVLKL